MSNSYGLAIFFYWAFCGRSISGVGSCFLLIGDPILVILGYYSAHTRLFPFGVFFLEFQCKEEED